MTDLKILLVEDAQEDIKACMSTVRRYKKEKKRNIEVVQVSKFSDARNELNNTFDGAIVDLRLDTAGEGNTVIKEIRSKYRVPVAVMTGTPQDAQTGVPYLGVFTKGETGYDELLDIFCATYDTGITKILGGRGYLETIMDKVFWKGVLPHLDEWKRYKENGKDTEKALLRFIISHITEFVDYDVDKYFLEEMYISPVESDALKTGCVVKRRDDDQYFVVLSPACDLAKHKGNYKTDRILVCYIQSIDNLINEIIQRQKEIQFLDSDDEKTKAKKEKSQNKIKLNAFEKISRNNLTSYYHFLPQTKVFSGGIINFRMIDTYTPAEFDLKFEYPIVLISAAFTKDIVSRFSSYYARQGQPDFDFDLVEK